MRVYVCGVCVYACLYANVFFLKCPEAAVSCWCFQIQPPLSMTPAVLTWVPPPPASPPAGEGPLHSTLTVSAHVYRNTGSE